MIRSLALAALPFLLAAPAMAGPPVYPAFMIDKPGAEHYAWGEGNDGWHLVRTDDMSVIQERMQPGTKEIRHMHRKARQFFYVLSGELTMEANGEVTLLRAGEGIEIPPGMVHQAQNLGSVPVEMLVNSTPKSHGDRVEVAAIAQ